MSSGPQETPVVWSFDFRKAENNVRSVPRLRGSVDGSMPPLVEHLVRLLLPGPESRESLFLHQLKHRDPALGNGLRELAIDERIVETDARRSGGRVAKVHTSQVRPIDSAQAHGAWLARGVNLAILKNESVELGASLANGYDLRVSRGIVGRGHAICTFR